MKKAGISIILLSAIVFTIDRLTQSISNLLGKVICGEHYLQPVDGVVGGLSCGFNMDMYIAVCLLGIFMTGWFLFLYPDTNRVIYLKS